MRATFMTAPRFHLSGFPRAIGFAVLLHLLVVLWMAASPALHAAAHPDASEPEHSCCVTLFEAGNFNAPTLHADFTAKAELPVVARIGPISVWGGETFVVLGILEHAPPATA